MTRPAQPIRHGTYAGYQLHQRRGVPMCDPCREARNEYRRRYLATNPGQATRNRVETNARHRAATRLAGEYPIRFAELFDEELAKEDIP